VCRVKVAVLLNEGGIRWRKTHIWY